MREKKHHHHLIDENSQDDKKASIRSLDNAFNENVENWPTEALKDKIQKLKPEEGAEVYLNLNPGDHDITKEALGLERRFRPIITLRTQELKTELTRWNIGGGSFFRVVADDPDLDKAYKVCIQYFILWTRQLFPFQFIFLSIPFFISTLFLWQFTAAYPPLIEQNGWQIYSALFVIGLVFILFGLWTYFEGLYRRFINGIKNWKVIPDSMIGFVVPGILLWTTALEYAIIDLVDYSGGFIALIPFSGWLTLALGLIVLIIGTDFYIRGEKSYVERFSHPMDYAPLLLFLEKNIKEEWEIEGAQFDFFHYRTTFVPKEKLQFHESDKEQENPWFLIDRSWHAFREYIKPNIMLRIFANVVVEVVLWLLIVAYYIVTLLARFDVLNIEFLNQLKENQLLNFLLLALSYLIIPMIVYLMMWAINRTKEFKLDLWEDMKSQSPDELMKYNYLSYDKLRILWNLRNKEHKGEQRITNLWSKSDWIEGDKSRLVARIKLQYPFGRYKEWKTLRDTEEELLSLISLQLKEKELEAIQEEIDKVKMKLFKYRRPFIKDRMKRRKMELEEEIIEGESENTEKIKSIE
ncbi:MAG TPA: hypothetical protein VMX55_09760 [candidate division Zixibacteria bacterium]|nr:hypothetical protein [candidate division Zixibacteria bacterium]